MGKIEWSVWANEQAIFGSLILFIGAIVGLSSKLFKDWLFHNIYSLFIAFFVFFYEYPRGKKKTGHTELRKFQQIIGSVHRRCGIFTKNYFIRFIIYTLLPLPSCFLLPTLFGALCFYVVSITYLVAALKGESWENISRQEDLNSATEPPNVPPPRLITDGEQGGETQGN